MAFSYELLVGRLPGRRSPLPSEVVEGLPKGVDELFELMACDDQAERIDSMAAVLRRVENIRGLDGQANAVTLYLKPPVELPSLTEMASVQASHTGLNDVQDDSFGADNAEVQQDPVRLSDNTENPSPSSFLDGTEAQHMGTSGSSSVVHEGMGGLETLNNAEVDENELGAESLDPFADQAILNGDTSQLVNIVDADIQLAEDLDDGLDEGMDPRSKTAVFKDDGTAVVDSINGDEGV